MSSPTGDLSLDTLGGGWEIYQLCGGHRYSTDDLLTAWTAVRARPAAGSLLDLGAGIGSVGLLTLRFLPRDARLTMVEVQQISHELACRTVSHNRLEARVRLHRMDLREWPGGAFELITGSPPYIPPGKGTQSTHPQKAAARFELHGDVADYCAAAARSLSEGGAFCFCHSARDPRPEGAIARAGLRLLQRRDVCFRADDPAMIALFTCAREGEREDAAPLLLRDRNGHWTDDYLRIRAEMGAPEAFLRKVGFGT